MTGVGQVVDGRFELLSPLGSGGMGAVWRALDLALQREVALKEVRTLDDTDPQVTQRRVRREAQALARLSHPNVVSIHHLIEDDPHPWLVMELVQGQPLDALIRDHGPLSPEQVARVARDVNRALRAAHEAGVHHRDVKPANVIIRPDGVAVLTDFGIAALTGDTQLTQSGMVIGSPEFMAPERLRADDDISASDLYSLGMLMLVAVDGRNPLRRSSPLATLAAVLDEPGPTPQHGGELTPLIRQLLSRDPRMRPTTQEVEAQLAAMETSTPPAPPTDASAPTAAASVSVALPAVRPTEPKGMPPGAATSSTRRRRVALVGAACLALVLGGGGLGLYLQNRGDDPGRTSARGTLPSAATSTMLPDASAGSGSAVPEGGGATPEAAGDADTGDSGAGDAPAQGAPSRSSEAPQSATASDAGGSDDDSGGDGAQSEDSGDGTDPVAVRAPGHGAWIAQLASVPVSSGTAARDARLRQIQRSFPGAATFSSSQYASLRSGYWVIWAGPYANGNSALSACHSAGFASRNACVGRLVTSDPSDRKYICTRVNSAGCVRD